MKKLRNRPIGQFDTNDSMRRLKNLFFLANMHTKGEQLTQLEEIMVHSNSNKSKNKRK